MSLKKVKEALKIIKDTTKTEFLVLFGGEPLVRPDIREIVDEVNRLGFEYTLISNGSIDDEETISRLKGFTLSIDRPEEEHAGIGEASKSSWSMLRKYKDIVPDLVANVTVTHENASDLEKIVTRLNEYDVWTVFGIVHSKRTSDEEATFRNFCPKLVLTADDLEYFKKAFHLAKKRHNTKEYIRLVGKHFNMMDWHCRYNPRNPEYMVILNDGSFAACSDHFGEKTHKLSIFDLPILGVDGWHQIVKGDREECRYSCCLNHEIQLASPDEKGYLKHPIKG